MQKHEWREETEEGLRYWRAEYHGSRWRLMTSLKGEEDWTVHEPIKREEWVVLRDVLWKKYQRNRCPWKLVGNIDKLLEDENSGLD